MARNSRNDYRKKRRRKRRRKAIASLFALLVIIGAVVAAITVFFKVSGIEVSGSTLYTAEEIIAASEIKVGDNMFAVNKFDVANRLLKAFPYIGEVKIRRRLPDTFTFEVTERKRAAFFQHEKFRWLVDKNGYILEGIPPQQEVAAPLVVDISLMAPTPGTKAAVPESEMFYSLTTLLTELENGELIEKAKQIDISKLYNLTLTYDNRFLIELGSTEELDAKIRMLNAVFGQLEATDKGVINVSDPKQARFRPDANVNLNLVKSQAETTDAASAQTTETPVPADTETVSDETADEGKADEEKDTEDSVKKDEAESEKEDTEVKE